MREVFYGNGDQRKRIEEAGFRALYETGRLCQGSGSGGRDQQSDILQGVFIQRPLEEILTERAEEVVEGLFAITEKDITSRNALSE